MNSGLQRKGEGGDLPDRAEGFPCGRSELEAPFAAIWISALGAGLLAIDSSWLAFFCCLF